ncbi:MAG: hypothetical protein KDC49_21675 [Saprospiraceae bacterium]|nr:hypothetical protein [Saprospiraceae bacterium]
MAQLVGQGLAATSELHETDAHALGHKSGCVSFHLIGEDHVDVVGCFVHLAAELAYDLFHIRAVCRGKVVFQANFCTIILEPDIEHIHPNRKTCLPQYVRGSFLNGLGMCIFSIPVEGDKFVQTEKVPPLQF